MISGALAVLKSEAQRVELSDFYEKNKNHLLNIALNILHNEEESEDAVQEAFLRIANKPDTFFSLSDKQRIRYMCAVAKNMSVDMFNKDKKLGTEELSENIALGNDSDSLENLVLDSISHKELIEFIGSLSPLQQSVLTLTRLSKLSISETARALNVSEKVVNQRLYMARKAIKKFIEERRN